MIHHRLRGLQKGGGTPVVSDVFATSLYTGSDGTQTITNGIDLAGQGGMVWIKWRNAAVGHRLQDTVRGIQNYLESHTTAESVSNGGARSVSSTGFTVDGTYGSAFNSLNNPYASWTFRKATRFFDVVTISHTNGAATNIDLTWLATLGLVIAKITNATGDWIAWHRSLTASNNLRLNTTAAQTTTNAWLSVSGTTATLSASAPTGSYVVYGFANDPDGVIQCGSFTTDQTPKTVTLGWEPQFVIIKTANAVEEWQIYDTTRGWSVGGSRRLVPNAADAEIGPISVGYPNSTGFTYSGVGSTDHIYMAIKKAS